MSEVIVDAIAETSVPQQLVDTFLPIVDECKIHFNDDGVAVRAVDPANVAMAYVDLSRNAFESYESPGSVTQGVALDRLDERLSVGNAGDLVNMALDMETRRLSVDVQNISQAMGLINPDSIRQEPDLPNLELPNTVVMSGNQISNAVDAIGMVSDHIEIVGNAEAGTVEFVGEGDTDKTVVEYDEDEAGDGTEVVDDVASLFSHEYVSNFVTPMPSDAEVTIHFGNEFPMIWEWTAINGNMEIKQLVAPRIQSN